MVRHTLKILQHLLQITNAINTCLINLNIILYHAPSLNIYEDPKYHQDQYYHNQLKNHKQIHLVQSFHIIC